MSNPNPNPNTLHADLSDAMRELREIIGNEYMDETARRRLLAWCDKRGPEIARRLGGDWQPIETAPKDGTEVIVYSSVGNPATAEGVRMAQFSYADDENDWWYTGEFIVLNPSHWMPLPAAPSEAAP